MPARRTKSARPKPVARRAKPKASATSGRPKGTSRSRPATAVSEAWALLVPLVAASLRQMKREQFLVLACSDAHRFVQFAVGGPGRIRGEVVSDHFLDEDERLTGAERKAITALGWKPPTHADDAPPKAQVKDGSPNWYRDFTGPGAAQQAAVAAAQTLRAAFKHEPAQVRYHAFTKEGEELLLPLSGIQPEAEWLSPGFRPDDLDDLREMVVDTLTGTGLGEVRQADGVDLVVEVGDRSVFVTAHDEPMSVLLYSVVGTADDGAESLATINDLNRSRNGCRAILYDGHLIVDRVLPGDPFVPRQLVEAVVELVAWGNSIAHHGAETTMDPALN